MVKTFEVLNERTSSKYKAAMKVIIVVKCGPKNIADCPSDNKTARCLKYFVSHFLAEIAQCEALTMHIQLYY